ncbi:Ig-like domain-containing protein [Anaerosporobacter sp.]|uniref:Ig-like domain-containing protein n=1 Tax=Anaerosporobacter sp. TaxID=1872529 RepID=UPI00286EF098|nr:Ig-like domain-containing protein [Anaerosporobacter sp.]
MKKRIITSLLVLLLVVTAIIPNTTAQAAVSISKSSLTTYEGDKTQLKITGTSKKVKWTSSKSSIASVDSTGKVTAKKKGTATITATVSSKKYTCKVTVKSATRTIKIPTEIYDTDIMFWGLLGDAKIIKTSTSGEYTLLKINAKSLDKQIKILKKDIDDEIEELVSTSIVSSVKYNKSLTTIDIHLSKNYSDDDYSSLLGLCVFLSYIQVYQGVEYEKADVYVTIYDENNIIQSQDYSSELLDAYY